MVYWKRTKGLPPLRRSKSGKKSQEKGDEIKNNKKLIYIGMIGNYNYIGASLNGLIQEVKSEGKTLFSFFKTKQKDIERLIGLAIQNEKNYISIIYRKGNI